MTFKYCETKSLGCFKNNLKCFLVKCFCFFKKNGKGLIFYKNFLDIKIINFIKFSIFYLNIKFSSYNFYISIKPYILKKVDNCLNLSLFISILFSFFKINVNKKILIFGGVNFKNGELINFANFHQKLKFLKKIDINLIIMPYSNNYFFLKKFSFLKFKYLYEIYKFFKRCLTQRKSNAITRHKSRVQFSQHLSS